MEKWKNIQKKKLKVAILFLFGIFLINFISARTIQCDLDSPIALYHFDENIGMNTTESCYGDIGYMNGDMNWSDGVFGKSVEFNGIDTYIDAGHYLVSEQMTNFSFSIWVNVSNGFYQTIFRRGYYYTTEFVELINIDEGDNNYVLFMGADTIGNLSIDDGKWHNIIGTFEGYTGTSTLYVDGNFISNYSTGYPEISYTDTNLYFGFNFDNGFLLDGTIDEAGFFNRTLTFEEITAFSNSSEINCDDYPLQIQFSQYPYFDVSVSETITLIVNPLFNNVQFNLTFDDGLGNFSSFILNKDNNFSITLNFSEIGDYYYTLNSSNICYGIETGMIYVREPFYITIKGFTSKENSTFFHSNKYTNNFAYATAEFTGTKTLFTNNYDTSLEPFVAPISDLRFKKPVWYAGYSNGEATIKLYEQGEYALRLIDGQITFDGTYAIPNVTESYGTNIYLGKYYLTNSTSYSFLFTEKDLHPYRWLLNYVFIILIVGTIIVSIFMFFVIPESPMLSVVLAIGGTITLTLLRIIIWVMWGY